MTKPAPTRHRQALAAFAFVNALAALGGAVGLMTGVLDMGAELNGRLPFASPVIGGLALTLLVAVPFSIVAVAAWRDDWRADLFAAACGTLLVGWILVQLAFIREVSFFHPFYVSIGLWLAWYGLAEARTEGRISRVLVLQQDRPSSKPYRPSENGQSASTLWPCDDPSGRRRCRC